jgi:hypothetical protein
MQDRTVVAIHQPNFFPWLGYFHKMVHADVFILMDDVQFPKTGSTWINRVQLMMNRQPGWFTVPVVRAYHGVRRICDMEIDNKTPWREKLLSTIRVNYTRTPFFRGLFSLLGDLVNHPSNLLAEFNIHAIETLADALSIDNTKLILSSSLAIESNATDLLIRLVKAVGGTTYLCGGGSSEYLEEEKFSAANIELLYQNFNHPVYSQRTTPTFIPGLSIIDALMNCGSEHVRALLSSTCIDENLR